MIKKQWFRDKKHGEFCKLITEAPKRWGSKRAGECFRDWVDMAYFTLLQPVKKLTTGTICPEVEANFMRIAEHYDMSKMSESMAILVMGLEEDYHDFLGTCYQTLGLADKEFAGQCFTPQSLCEVIIRMTMGEVTPDPNKRLTVSEPCVGGGAMAIALTKYLTKERGFYPWNWHLWCNDVASLCHRMAYIQLTLCGAPAWVSKYNTISGPDQYAEHSLTLAGVLHPYREHKEVPPEDAVRARFKPKTEEPVRVRVKPIAPGAKIAA